MNTKIIVILLLIIGLIVAVLTWSGRSADVSLKPLTAEATVYMGEYCGCCQVYASYLSRQGLKVETVTLSDQDLMAFKQDHNIPSELYSCHTTVINDYLIEGHIPTEAIAQLLEEKPTIAGIGLPGMPSGTPGMPGPKLGPWSIKAIGSDGSVSEFLTL